MVFIACEDTLIGNAPVLDSMVGLAINSKSSCLAAMFFAILTWCRFHWRARNHVAPSVGHLCRFLRWAQRRVEAHASQSRTLRHGQKCPKIGKSFVPSCSQLKGFLMMPKAGFVRPSRWRHVMLRGQRYGGAGRHAGTLASPASTQGTDLAMRSCAVIFPGSPEKGAPSLTAKHKTTPSPILVLCHVHSGSVRVQNTDIFGSAVGRGRACPTATGIGRLNLRDFSN